MITSLFLPDPEGFSLQHAKILCTLGPATATPEKIRDLIEVGADAIRLNFSHAAYETHKALFDITRKVSSEMNKHIPIIQDLQGPKIRVGALPNGPITLVTNEVVTITIEKVLPGDNRIPSGYKNLINDVKVGDSILIDDGLLALKVESKDNSNVYCRVINGGLLKEKKGMNLPGVKISEPSMTEKDLEDLDFGLKLGVDYVALSFVRSAKDITSIKELIQKKGYSTPVIAKIEKVEALMELDSIILASDAIMIARGDLGVEIPSHEVPLWQKRIIKKCNQAGRCVITATQMLESMVMNPRPTRAESSDVANAVLDGTDVVMLSAETSVGAYPIESVRTMNDIIESAESIMLYGQSIKHPPSIRNEDERSEYAIASAACELSEQVGAKAILCFTYRGVTAKMMSRQRPDIPIIAITQNEKICRMLMLYNGVEALALKEQPVSTDDAIVLMKKTAFENGYVKKGDRVILTAGYPVVTKARTNMMVIDVI